MEKLLKTGIIAILAGFFTVSGPIDAANAQSAGDTIKQRRALMKEMGGHTKAVKKFIKGPKAGLTGKKLKKAMNRIGKAPDMELRAILLASQAKRLASYFPKGTSLADNAGETGAKPEIWAKWGEFKAAAAAMGSLAESLAKASATGDKAKMKAAVTALGKKGCGGCHKPFRKKLKKKKKASS